MLGVCPSQCTWGALINGPRGSSFCVLTHSVILALCSPVDCSPPGTSVRGIFPARIRVALPLPGDLPGPGTEPVPLAPPAPRADPFLLSHQGGAVPQRAGHQGVPDGLSGWTDLADLLSLDVHEVGVLKSPLSWGAMTLARPALGCLSQLSVFCVFHPFVPLLSYTGHFLEGHQCLGPKHAVLNITRSVSPAASTLVGSAAIPSPLIGGD